MSDDRPVPAIPEPPSSPVPDGSTPTNATTSRPRDSERPTRKPMSFWDRSKILVLFLGIIGACLSCALRAARVAEQRGDVKLEALARAVFLALIGVLTSELFISQMHGKLLWGLLALGPAMLAIARAEPAEPVLAPSSGERLVASGPLA